MKSTIRFKIFLSLLCTFVFTLHTKAEDLPLRVLANLEALEALQIKPQQLDRQLNVGIAQVTSAQRNQILKYNHDKGRCGGFEVLEQENSFMDSSNDILRQYKNLVERDQASHMVPYPQIQKSLKIQQALGELKASRLKESVTWLSGFPQRDSKASNPNSHVEQLKQKLESVISGHSFADISLIDHRRTRQKSLKVRLTGAQKPDEIIVLGGHLDSINTSWYVQSEAPGADDNASGSANLMETLRILLKQGQPARTIEFFWYAAEEAGLVGSSEIAQQYKASAKNVIGVLQLDMTLFAGSGELTIASISDNTTPWLRDLLVQINNHYIGARLIEDRCGYACSDHASWYRQGFATLLPFESATRKINRNIHSASDTIDNSSNFNHSLAFSKIALAFAMELGNSDLKNP